MLIRTMKHAILVITIIAFFTNDQESSRSLLNYVIHNAYYISNIHLNDKLVTQ